MTQRVAAGEAVYPLPRHRLDMFLVQRPARRIGLAMLGYVRSFLVLLLGVLWLWMLVAAPPAVAHAALVRSEPAAGEVLSTAPAEIRLWFSEPLEARFTGAQVLTVTGDPVAGTTSAVEPDDDHQLIVTLPASLPAGSYTVAWRNLSAADGHSLEGYFGFSVGAATASGPVAAEFSSTTGQPLPGLVRGLTLLGLAMVLAIAPVTLGVLMPAANSAEGAPERLWPILRRYAVVAAVIALLANLAALAIQAATIAPDRALPTAIGETLTGTRYGELWLIRIALLGCCAALVFLALWGSLSRRRAGLVIAALLALVAPLPFSLISHAAAQTPGTIAAVVNDALHLLAASIWGGGLFLLAAVLIPVLRPLPLASWRAALRVAIPRFTVIGVAAWGILLCSGIYSAWLQVGSIEALRETPYGQTLLLKGVLLLPVLALAVFHLVLGRSGVVGQISRRVAMTFVLEALLVVAVLLVVGRLIGLEPARAVLAERTPAQLTIPLLFETDEGSRPATLVISPGAPGINTFTLEVSGAPLSEAAEGVLRFALPAAGIGAQELRLPRTVPNRFSEQGSELSLAGDWQIEAIVREIGAFSWSTDITMHLDAMPPAAPEVNPPPRFGPAGVVALLVLALGLVALASAVLWPGVTRARRGTAAIASVALLVLGSVALTGSRIPIAISALALPPATPVTTPPPVASSAATPVMSHDHEMPESPLATPEVILPGSGTPVRQDDLTVTITAEPNHLEPAAITIEVTDSQGAPVSNARVVVFAQMMTMRHRTEETVATEVAPGRYRADTVFFSMPGSWQVNVRVSPKGESTQVFRFAVDVA